MDGTSIAILKISWGRGDSLSKSFQQLTTLICLLFRQSMLESNFSMPPYRVVQFLFTLGEICFVLLFLCQITVQPRRNDTACYYRDLEIQYPGYPQRPSCQAERQTNQRDFVPIWALQSPRLISTKWVHIFWGAPFLWLKVMLWPLYNHSSRMTVQEKMAMLQKEKAPIRFTCRSDFHFCYTRHLSFKLVPSAIGRQQPFLHNTMVFSLVIIVHVQDVQLKQVLGNFLTVEFVFAPSVKKLVPIFYNLGLVHFQDPQPCGISENGSKVPANG